MIPKKAYKSFFPFLNTSKTISFEREIIANFIMYVKLKYMIMNMLLLLILLA